MGGEHAQVPVYGKRVRMTQLKPLGTRGASKAAIFLCLDRHSVHFPHRSSPPWDLSVPLLVGDPGRLTSLPSCLATFSDLFCGESFRPAGLKAFHDVQSFKLSQHNVRGTHRSKSPLSLFT